MCSRSHLYTIDLRLEAKSASFRSPLLLSRISIVQGNVSPTILRTHLARKARVRQRFALEQFDDTSRHAPADVTEAGRKSTTTRSPERYSPANDVRS